MVEKKEADLAAFPRSGAMLQVKRDQVVTILPQAGMSLRDYFAAAAMQAFMTDHTIGPEPKAELAERVAAVSYKVADAMLAQRDLPTDPDFEVKE